MGVTSVSLLKTTSVPNQAETSLTGKVVYTTGAPLRMPTPLSIKIQQSVHSV